MYILLSLLLLTPPASAELSIAELCKEVAIEVAIAVEEGYLDKQAAAGILQGCGDLRE